MSGILCFAVAAATAGCSALDLGPEPSTYIGPSAQPQGQPITDAHLQAVLPEVPGDRPGGAANVPAATLPSTTPVPVPPLEESATPGPAGVTPATMPATQPAAASAPAPAPAAPAAGQPSAPPQSLSVQEAILIGLENNANLRVQRFNVPIARQGEEQELATFDPDVSGTLQGGRDVTNVGFGPTTTDSISGNPLVQVTEFLPTGTTITAKASSVDQFYSESVLNQGAQIQINQALLRGAGIKYNLAKLREAELATKISQYRLRDSAQALVAQIETQYWTLAYDQRQVTIVQNALKVAQDQLDQTNAEIRAGRLAPTENAAAVAQVAVERQDLINANSQLEKDQLAFEQTIMPTGAQFWNRPVTLTTYPFIPSGEMDPVVQHVAVAMKLRPDINEARLQFQSDTLEVVRTKNLLLPQLDMFVQLTKSTVGTNFAQSFRDVDGPYYQAILGINYDWSPVNRAASAQYRVANLTRDQQIESIKNLMQVDEQAVRTDYIEVMRTLAQIPAARATREADEVSLTTEQQKLLTGRSTPILVAAAQQNLLAAQLVELQEVTGHLTALVTLYEDEGTLLVRRGIDAPGTTPPPDPAWRK